MRPSFHYAPAANWLSDPNGLIHHRGKWHLFYQYNPQGEDWGHMSWGHAISDDLIAWQELPTALVEDDRHLIFSGSAVVDTHGTAGMGPDTIVAVYTGAAKYPVARQEQCLAFSHDEGLTWTKYARNPVIDRGLADFRDPNVFWHAGTGRWIMVVVLSADQAAVIYGSDNLKDWEELSVIPALGAPGAIWECPLLIELPLENSPHRRWLFKVDVLDGGPGSGAIYQTGTFDGRSFVPDIAADGSCWKVADWGSDFYAAIAWHAPRDPLWRPAWIGWLGNHAYQAKLPLQGWRGAMSLPRRLSLTEENGIFWLVQTVDAGLEQAVSWHHAGATRVQGPCRLTLPGNKPTNVQISDGHGRRIIVERNGAMFKVCRIDPETPALALERSATIAAEDDLDCWIDFGSAEIFTTSGRFSLAIQHRLAALEVTIRDGD